MVVNMLESISPGCIRRVYFINAPRMFVALFNTIRKLVTVRADIYAMDSNEKKWKQTLSEFIPEKGLIKEFGGNCTSLIRI